MRIALSNTKHTIPTVLPFPPLQAFLWQVFASANLLLGFWYLVWRWSESLNGTAFAFSLPLVIAETCAYVGLLLMTYNLWTQDEALEKKRYPIAAVDGRRLKVDVLITTYNEAVDLVRQSVIAAKNLVYPHPFTLNIYILDDGCRGEMAKMAAEQRVHYIERHETVGHKAGNLCNAILKTDGDFMIICDADTQLFANFLRETTGYFKDDQIAWVQTPQWFYDLPQGRSLVQSWQDWFGRGGKLLAKGLSKLIGEIRLGRDPLRNDPRMFYEVILRRRNRVNAAFCCGAASIHRRSALLQACLNRQKEQCNSTLRNEPPTPYKLHVSEDIYTSILMQEKCGVRRGWKSVQHPHILSQMLSPQDLRAWVKQRLRYAEGTLDILLHDCPLFRKGLNVKQKLMYAATFWSYLGGFWNAIFMLWPIVFLWTGLTPVNAYTSDFVLHALPFFLCTEIAFMLGSWGLSNWHARSGYLAFFPYNLYAFFKVLLRRPMQFNTTRKFALFDAYIKESWVHILVLLLTAGGLIFAWQHWLGGGYRYSFTGLVANTLWGVHNVCAVWWVVAAAFRKEEAIIL